MLQTIIDRAQMVHVYVMYKCLVQVTVTGS